MAQTREELEARLADHDVARDEDEQVVEGVLVAEADELEEPIRIVGIVVKVSPGIANNSTGTTTITNVVNVVAAQDDDPTATNNSFSLTTLVVTRADLRIGKECKPDEPAPTGTNATCTITVDNLGPSDAFNVVVTDTHVSEGSFSISSAVVIHGPTGQNVSMLFERESWTSRFCHSRFEAKRTVTILSFPPAAHSILFDRGMRLVRGGSGWRIERACLHATMPRRAEGSITKYLALR